MRTTDRFWWALVLLPPLLWLPDLGDSWLWQDEAETALLGRAVLLHGYPLADDGRHVITDQPGIDVNEDGVWIWTPWLQHYVAAASFAVLGESTAAARVPFVLFGWLALLLTYALAREVTGERTTARLAALLLLASVPFALHVRQCRYYAPLAAFTALHIWGYLRLVRGARGGGVMLALGGLGISHTFLPQLVVSSLAALLHAAGLRRDRALTVRLVLWSLPVIAGALPFFLYSRGWSRDYGGAGYGFDGLFRYLATLRTYLIELHLYVLPFVLGLPWAWRRLGTLPAAWRTPARAALAGAAAAWALAVSAPPSRVTFALLGVLTFSLAALSLVVVARNARSGSGGWLVVGLTVAGTVALVAGLAPAPFFRYLVGVLPLCLIATAALIRSVAPGRAWVAIALAALVVGSDLLHAAPFRIAAPVSSALGAPAADSDRYQGSLGSTPSNRVAAFMLRQQGNHPMLRSLPAEYARELATEYVGPNEAVVLHLREHASPGDTIATTYGHFPLMFYTDLRVTRPEWLEQGELPEWVHVHGARPPPELVTRSLARWERVRIDARAFPWENVPEPHSHRFVVPDAGPRVQLLRRRP